MIRPALKVKHNLHFALVLTLYSIVGLFFLKYYQYQINPDGISYISIAQKYLNGDFANAINGYWPPLISWLLIPFLFFGLPQLLAVKVLSLIIGIVTITGMRMLSYRFEIAESIRTAVLYSLIPLILFFGLSIATPDFLLACVLVYYLNIIFNPEYPGRVLNGVLCGALGAGAYLAKTYAFPFFISHFLLFNLFHYFRTRTTEKKKGVLLNVLCGIALFSMISGPWIAIISKKYQEVTIGMTGSLNYNPQHRRGILHGFVKPPYSTAISAWEDPAALKVEFSAPAQKGKYIKDQVTLKAGNFYRNARKKLMFIVGNFYRIIRAYESFSPLAITIVLGYILLLIRPFRKVLSSGDGVYPLSTIFLYSVGYTPFWVEKRYLWLVSLLLILMGAHLLNILFQSDFFTGTRKKLALLFFMACSVAMPSKALINGMNADKNIYSLSKRIESEHKIKGNIASSSKWVESLYLTYYFNGRYYGMAKENTSDKELEESLRRNDIDYYIVWGDTDSNLGFLSNNWEITGRKTPGLKIYSLKDG